MPVEKAVVSEETNEAEGSENASAEAEEENESGVAVVAEDVAVDEAKPESEEVPLSPEHGFEFYLAVKEALGGKVNISEIYGAAAAHPEVKTVAGLVRVMEE